MSLLYGIRNDWTRLRQSHRFWFLVLSPLDVGPVIDRDEGEGNLFVQDIAGLKANGGGDCKELAFQGIYNAMTEAGDPEFNSPLFVFTDAPPKDGKDNEALRKAKFTAQENKVSVTFFVARDCGTDESYAPYHELAECTGGYVFNLPNTDFIQQMTGYNFYKVLLAHPLHRHTNTQTQTHRHTDTQTQTHRHTDTILQIATKILYGYISVRAYCARAWVRVVRVRACVRACVCIVYVHELQCKL